MGADILGNFLAVLLEKPSYVYTFFCCKAHLYQDAVLSNGQIVYKMNSVRRKKTVKSRSGVVKHTN